MSPLTADQAIVRARALRPAAFMTLDVDFSLTEREYRRQESQLAWALLYGHLVPQRTR